MGILKQESQNTRVLHMHQKGAHHCQMICAFREEKKFMKQSSKQVVHVHTYHARQGW